LSENIKDVMKLKILENISLKVYVNGRINIVETTLI
jgi:hypothetical protein